MKYSNLLNKLNEIYKHENFNLALHTTRLEYADSILEKGLMEKGFRKIEGTIKFVGDLEKNVNERTLDFFFADTNVTMLIALPKFLDTNPTRESYGGIYTTCDFSRFLELLVRYKIRHKEIDKTLIDNFTFKGFKVIPSQMIIGFYDKEENFYPNKKCYIFNKDKSLINTLEKEYKRLHNKINEEIFDNQI